MKVRIERTTNTTEIIEIEGHENIEDIYKAIQNPQHLTPKKELRRVPRKEEKSLSALSANPDDFSKLDIIYTLNSAKKKEILGLDTQVVKSVIDCFTTEEMRQFSHRTLEALRAFSERFVPTLDKEVSGWQKIIFKSRLKSVCKELEINYKEAWRRFGKKAFKINTIRIEKILRAEFSKEIAKKERERERGRRDEKEAKWYQEHPPI